MAERHTHTFCITHNPQGFTLQGLLRGQQVIHSVSHLHRDLLLCMYRAAHIHTNIDMKERKHL